MCAVKQESADGVFVAECICAADVCQHNPYAWTFWIHALQFESFPKLYFLSVYCACLCGTQNKVPIEGE